MRAWLVLSIALWFQPSCFARTSGQVPPACVQVQKRQGVRLLGVGFCQVGENHRVLGILAQVSQWSGDCGSWLGRRVCREGRRESRRFLAERKEAEADCELCAG